jgi:type II secretory pathway component GspD/PulD (secretin)
MTSVVLRSISWLLAALTPAIVTAEELRLIELRHRTAEELLPILSPAVPANEALTGRGHQLIHRGSPQTRRQLEQLLAQLDVAAQTLKITVRQTSVQDADRARYTVSGAGSATSGNVRVYANRPSPAGSEPGLTATVGGRSGHVRVDASTLQTRARDESVQTLRVRDGARAHIRLGQSIPHVRTILALTNNQTILNQGIELQDVTTGFDVLPRVRGDQVLLEITPRLSSLANPAIGLVNFSELRTTVMVRRGEWIDLGQLGGTGSEVRRTLLDSASHQEGERRTVLLKIE